MRTFWGGVARNVNRSHRRWRRGRISPIPREVDLPTLTDGTVLLIPPDDDLAPDLPPGTLSLLPLFGFVESPLAPEADSGGYGRNLSVQAPRRSVEDFDDPSPQRVRTESQGGHQLVFRERHQLVLSERLGTFTVSEEDGPNAICFPLED